MKGVLFLMVFAYALMSFEAREHPLKMSFSQITVQENNYAKVTTRFFEDDLSMHLKNTYRLQEISYEDNSTNGWVSLERYINNRATIKQNNEVFDLKISSITIDSKKTVLEVEYHTVEKLELNQPVQLELRFLTELFQNQINQLNYNNKNLRLNRLNHSITLKT